jgi:hypothetical protein
VDLWLRLINRRSTKAQDSLNLLGNVDSARRCSSTYRFGSSLFFDLSAHRIACGDTSRDTSNRSASKKGNDSKMLAGLLHLMAKHVLRRGRHPRRPTRELRRVRRVARATKPRNSALMEYQEYRISKLKTVGRNPNLRKILSPWVALSAEEPKPPGYLAY